MKQQAHRIETGGKGFGEADDRMVEERARGFARLSGRSEPNEHDIEEALRALRNPVPEDLTDSMMTEAERPGSGVPATSSGTHTPRVKPDDEESIANQLVHEGVEEADWESRVASAERPDQEE